MNIFKKIFCGHKWKLHYELKGAITYPNGRVDQYIIHTLICEHCGKIKQIKL